MSAPCTALFRYLAWFLKKRTTKHLNGHSVNAAASDLCRLDRDTKGFKLYKHISNGKISYSSMRHRTSSNKQIMTRDHSVFITSSWSIGQNLKTPTIDTLARITRMFQWRRNMSLTELHRKSARRRRNADKTVNTGRFQLPLSSFWNDCHFQWSHAQRVSPLVAYVVC